MLAISIAGVAAVLGVPRAVAPWEVPGPFVEPAALAAVMDADVRRARELEARAGRGEVDHDVRALGGAVRDFGRAESADRATDKEAAHRKATNAARAAIVHGPELLLGMRAFQARAFLREVRAFARTGVASEDLVELSGALPLRVVEYRWYDPVTRELRADDAALLALYKKRWNEVTGLRGSAFELTLDEERALHGLLIAHPPVVVAALPAGATAEAKRSRALATAAADDERRLVKIRELAKLDASYPGAFAEGVVLFRLGKLEAAAMAFERHLAAHPDGPWTLRARNHLKAALEGR